MGGVEEEETTSAKHTSGKSETEAAYNHFDYKKLKAKLRGLKDYKKLKKLNYISNDGRFGRWQSVGLRRL